MEMVREMERMGKIRVMERIEGVRGVEEAIAEIR